MILPFRGYFRVLEIMQAKIQIPTLNPATARPHPACPTYLPSSARWTRTRTTPTTLSCHPLHSEPVLPLAWSACPARGDAARQQRRGGLPPHASAGSASKPPEGLPSEKSSSKAVSSGEASMEAGMEAGPEAASREPTAAAPPAAPSMMQRVKEWFSGKEYKEKVRIVSCGEREGNALGKAGREGGREGGGLRSIRRRCGPRLYLFSRVEGKEPGGIRDGFGGGFGPAVFWGESGGTRRCLLKTADSKYR